MITIARILDRHKPHARGEEWTLTLDNPPFHTLVITGIGVTTDGAELVSVCRSREKGKVEIRDPEIVFAVYRELTIDHPQTNTSSFENALWMPAGWASDIEGDVCQMLGWSDDGTVTVLDAKRSSEVGAFASELDRELKSKGLQRVEPVEVSGAGR